MSTEKLEPNATLALNTKLEDDFVSPLTAIRGALEIMRDFPDLTPDQRERFVNTALRACTRLELAVDDLATSVYRAGTGEVENDSSSEREDGRRAAADNSSEWSNRFNLHPDENLVEVDMSAIEFSSSAVVNAFYDALENALGGTSRRWFFLVNYKDCKVWPEAWVAFAHRAKKINVNFSSGSARYIHHVAADKTAAARIDPETYSSREAALAYLRSIGAKGI